MFLRNYRYINETYSVFIIGKLTQASKGAAVGGFLSFTM